MVQRKVSNKLGIQADHGKSEKRLVNLKSSSYQYQDGKNRGPDMKKKMKKSRSIKLSDIESLNSSSLKQTISQPGKPPPLSVQPVAATPQKQSPVKPTDGSPNYMKSTSSSEARKEISQVSSRYSQSGSDSKNMRRKKSSNSKLSSGSSNKPARNLTKTSSLKLVRTLTKTPSFKPVRACAKKCSRVVICEDMNAQRATCSSTLKDSKFPAYLMLDPGGTEAEGTSATKVCPYNYCSLNGHRHTPLPPLKCFLSARRRLLKTQRGMKLEALSPRRVKPVGESTEQIAARQVFFDDKPAYKEGDLDFSSMSPQMKEGGMGFFIEIYGKNKEGNPESPFGGCDEAKVEHKNDKQVAESLSDGLPHSEIDFEENLQQESGIISMRVDTAQGFLEEHKVEDPEEDYLQLVVQNEAVPERFYNGNGLEGECNASTEETDNISEANDMEWEEGQFSISEADTEDSYSTNDENESDSDDGDLPEIKNHDFFNESILKSDNMIVDFCEEIVADEVFEEQRSCFNPERDDSDSEMDDIHRNSETVESSLVSDSSSYDQQPSTEETETELIKVMVPSAWTEEPIAETAACAEEIQKNNGVLEVENGISETGSQLVVVETYYTPEVTDENLNDQQKDKSLRDDDMTKLLQNQISDSFQHLDKPDQIVTDDGYNGSQEPRDSEGDQNVAINDFDLEKEISNREAGVQMEEKEQVAVTKVSIGVQVDIKPVAITKISIGVQVPEDFYEANEEDAEVDEEQNHIMNEPCQLEDFAEDSISGQDKVDEILPDETQNHQSESEFDSMHVADQQNFLEKNEEKDEVKKFKIPSPMDSEEQSDSRMLSESSIEETEKMEVEDSVVSDKTEAIPNTGSKNIPEFETSTCSNQKWTVRPKRPVNDEENLRDFNPREPNFLPVVPEPDAEKVDLKHQMLDERKNAEEWMVDYALRQAVTKLAPARKKKVALLVEAFETVMPISKWETHLRHSSASFSPGRPIQACS